MQAVSRRRRQQPRTRHPNGVLCLLPLRSAHAVLQVPKNQSPHRGRQWNYVWMLSREPWNKWGRFHRPRLCRESPLSSCPLLNTPGCAGGGCKHPPGLPHGEWGVWGTAPRFTGRRPAGFALLLVAADRQSPRRVTGNTRLLSHFETPPPFLGAAQRRFSLPNLHLANGQLQADIEPTCPCLLGRKGTR